MRTEFFPYEVIQTIIQKQWGRTGKATRLFRLKLGLDQKGIHFCKKRIIQITAIKFKNLFEKEYHLVLICMFSHVHNFFITFMYCRYGNQKQQLSEVTVKSTKYFLWSCQFYWNEWGHKCIWEGGGGAKSDNDKEGQ